MARAAPAFDFLENLENTIADKIMELRDNNETCRYMLMRCRYTCMRDVLYHSMTKIIGSPNNISHSAICAEAEKSCPYYTEGVWDYVSQYKILGRTLATGAGIGLILAFG